MTNTEKKQFLAQYETIHEPLMRFCIVKSHGIMDPKDLANDVLLIGMENYSKLENKDALLSYLFTTANRICLNKARRKKFSGTYDEGMAERIADPKANAEARVDVSILYAALDQLPALQKEAVTLFEISDLPIKEIMVIQNSGASAVKQRIKRGREKLAEIMREKDQKKTAVVAAVLFSTNSFSMSNLDSYFNAVKDLPLPLSNGEVTSAVNNFALSGTATNATATKIGSAVVKKMVLSAVIVSGAVTTTVLLSTTADPVNHSQISQAAIVDFSTDESPASKPTEKVYMYTDSFSEEGEEAEQSNSSNEVEKINTSIDPIHSGLSPLPSNKLAPLNQLNLIEKTTEDEVLEGDSFSLSGVDILNIHHLGNHLEIKIWDKKELKIVANHTIEGKTEKDEALMREYLGAVVHKNGRIMTVSTNKCIKNQHIKTDISTITFDGGKKVKYKKLNLHYTLMLPADMNLKINGSYDELTVPDMSGDLTTNVRDAKIKIGDIKGKTNLKFHYATGEMGSFGNAKMFFFESKIGFGAAEKLDLTAKYSVITADQIKGSKLILFESKMTTKKLNGNLHGNLKYASLDVEKSAIKKSDLILFESTIEAPKIENLDINLRYSSLICSSIKSLNIRVAFESKILVDEVSSLNAETSKYSTYEIEMLKKEIDMVSFEDKLTIKKTNVSSMNFKGKYTNYDITLAKPANYLFQFDAKYGNLNYDGLDLTVENTETQNSQRSITGYFDNGNKSNATIKFDCFESDVRLK